MPRRKDPTMGNIKQTVVVTQDPPATVQSEMEQPYAPARGHVAMLDYTARVAERVQSLLANPEGYMRIAPDEKAGAHLIYQWTLGLHRGRYVYWYCPQNMSWIEGLDGLLDKVDAVYEGRKRPSKVSIR